MIPYFNRLLKYKLLFNVTSISTQLKAPQIQTGFCGVLHSFVKVCFSMNVWCAVKITYHYILGW